MRAIHQSKWSTGSAVICMALSLSGTAVFGGHIRRDKNSEQLATAPNQRYSSWLLGYQYKV